MGFGKEIRVFCPTCRKHIRCEGKPIPHHSVATRSPIGILHKPEEPELPEGVYWILVGAFRIGEAEVCAVWETMVEEGYPYYMVHR